MRLLTILFATSIIVSSCSIQKRTFRNGYYISWNKPLKPKTNENRSEEIPETKPVDELLVSSDIEAPKPTEDPALISTSDTLQKTGQSVTNDSLTKIYKTIDTELAINTGKNETVNPVKARKTPRKEWEPSGRSPNLFAINSFVFAVGYVILIFYAFAVSGVTWAIALAVICFFVALIFAIIGIIKWKRHRDDFWGTFFALMALIVLVTGTFALLLVFIGNMGF